VSVRIAPAVQADPGEVIAMGSTLAVSAGATPCRHLDAPERLLLVPVLSAHPAGSVGQITDAPDELSPLDASR